MAKTYFLKKMVSQSKNGFQKDGFSIKKCFSKRWFLNQKMVFKKMVSQSNDGKKIFSQKYFFSKNGSLNRKWQKIYFLKKYFFSKNGISIVNGLHKNQIVSTKMDYQSMNK